MRLLVDTHAFLWFLNEDQRLNSSPRAAIEDEQNIVFVSAATCWEITTKYRLGKLPEAAVVAADVAKVVRERGFDRLDISLEHGQHAGAFTQAHRDPFDRMIAAQALLEGLTLVSKDTAFDAFGVRRIW